VIGTPIWFGPEDRPLFGWFHLPDSTQMRTAVVLCPPIAGEALNAQYTYRLLAESLCRSGFGVLRFDYDGTGDSAGDPAAPGGVETWLGSIRAAVELTRASGAGQVAVVGMRVGATLAAAELARSGPVDSVVLWDPCLTGRAFLREQRALYTMTFARPNAEDGSTEIPGFVYCARTARELEQLDMTASGGALAPRVLVLSRPERSAEERLGARLAGSDVTWTDAVGQEALLDIATTGIVPQQSLETIVAWLSGATRTDMAPVAVPASKRAVVASDRTGRPVVESPVRLGPTHLFGIVCAAEGFTRGPTVVILNSAAVHRIGPARTSVDLARRWAVEGLRVVRFDLSGIGDGPTRPGQPENVVRAPEAMEDVVDALKAVSPDDPSAVVLVGLCSGAYQALEAGLEVGPRGVCAVNPILKFVAPELHHGRTDRRRRLLVSWRAWARVWRQGRWLLALDHHFPDIPDPIWWAINRAAVRNRPGDRLAQIVDRGTDVLLICGRFDGRQIERGARRRLRRLESTGRFHFELIPDLDHGLQVRNERERALQDLFHHVTSRFAQTAKADEHVVTDATLT